MKKHSYSMKTKGKHHHEVNETSLTETTRAQKVALRIMIDEILTRIDNILFNDALIRLEVCAEFVKHAKDSYAYYEEVCKVIEILRELKGIIEDGRITSEYKLDRLLKVLNELIEIVEEWGD